MSKRNFEITQHIYFVFGEDVEVSDLHDDIVVDYKGTTFSIHNESITTDVTITFLGLTQTMTLERVKEFIDLFTE